MPISKLTPLLVAVLALGAAPELALVAAAGACSTPGSSPNAAPNDGSAPLPDSTAAATEAGRDAGAERASPNGDGGAASDAEGVNDGARADDSTGPEDAAVLPGWSLTWSDEFDGADGSAIDLTKWTQRTGNSGWNSNHELEYYTSATANAVVEGGNLVITAAAQGASQYQCVYGTCLYTSARFDTAGKFSQQYGRFEARIKVPRGQGMWPAFWMEGSDKPAVGWPDCGEIDIMENVGATPSTDYGSMHGPGYSGTSDLTAHESLADGGALADDFHLYAIEWEEGSVHFFLDAVEFETRTPADIPAGDTWVYDQPFYILLNVAVGGYWPGNPDGSTQFPQAMLVDYVRVYQKTP